MMKKKIFALVLALVMVLALVPAMAQAGSEQRAGGRDHLQDRNGGGGHGERMGH